MFKIDLHTHSTASPDGGINRLQYKKAMHTGLLDYIAVTDHNTIKFARLLHQEFGDRVIIGEEIMTSVGEIIGLFLEERIKPGQTPLETVRQIKEQGGFVYVPHPFETIRKGLHPAVLEELVDYVDIIEIYNGRAWLQNRNAQAVVWTRLNQKIGAASSDAHGYGGLGRTFTSIAEPPTADNLLRLLDNGTPQGATPSIRALLYPKYHRIRKRLTGK
jgi:predicted metal-dependent phosphoesterase TrpH